MGGGCAVKTDHWFYGLFQSAPDLITLLLPDVVAASLGPDAPGDALYRFEAPELKAANHRLDGALWPRGNERGTPQQPVVLLEVQMHSKPGFKHRLAAQSFRFLQLHRRSCTWRWWLSCPTGDSAWGLIGFPISWRGSLAACTGSVSKSSASSMALILC